MIKLLANKDPQSFSVIPRDSSATFFDVTLRRDGDGITEEFTNVTISMPIGGKYLDLSLTSQILQEGETYSLEVSEGTNLVFRDKIFATNKTDSTIKHVSTDSYYTEPDAEINDNTYII